MAVLHNFASLQVAGIPRPTFYVKRKDTFGASVFLTPLSYLVIFLSTKAGARLRLKPKAGNIIRTELIPLFYLRVFLFTSLSMSRVTVSPLNVLM